MGMQRNQNSLACKQARAEKLLSRHKPNSCLYGWLGGFRLTMAVKYTFNLATNTHHFVQILNFLYLAS